VRFATKLNLDLNLWTLVLVDSLKEKEDEGKGAWLGLARD
jgi:hypothetical protein